MEPTVGQLMTYIKLIKALAVFYIEMGGDPEYVHTTEDIWGGKWEYTSRSILSGGPPKYTMKK